MALSTVISTGTLSAQNGSGHQGALNPLVDETGQRPERESCGNTYGPMGHVQGACLQGTGPEPNLGGCVDFRSGNQEGKGFPDRWYKGNNRESWNDVVLCGQNISNLLFL